MEPGNRVRGGPTSGHRHLVGLCTLVGALPSFPWVGCELVPHPLTRVYLFLFMCSSSWSSAMTGGIPPWFALFAPLSSLDASETGRRGPSSPPLVLPISQLA